jgi:hypothetical protein
MSQFHAANLAFRVYNAQQRLDRLEKDHLRRQEQQAVLTQPATSSPDSDTLDSTQAGAAASSTTADSNGHAQTGPSRHQEAASAQQDSLPDSQHTQQPDQSAEDQARLNAEYLAAKAALEEATLPVMLDAMWAANVLDIQNTLRHVCQKALKDPQVSKQERKARAQALRAMGYIFQEVALIGMGEDAKDATKPTFGDAKQRMEDAMMRLVEKRNTADDRMYANSNGSSAC